MPLLTISDQGKLWFIVGGAANAALPVLYF